MNPRWIAGGGAAILLVGAGLLIGRATRDGSPPRSTSPPGSAAPSVPGPTASTPSATPTFAEPESEPVRAATVDARGRTVEVSSVTAAGLRDVRLSGSTVTLSVTGRITDPDGRDLGEGTLRAGGSAVDLAGDGIEFGPASMRLRSADALILEDGPSIETGSKVAVRASTLEIQSSDGKTRRLPGTLVSVGGARLVRLDGTSLRWRNPPQSLVLSGSGRVEVSWSDRGTVGVPGVGTFSTQRGGVVFSSVRGTVRRGSPVTVSATGDPLQVYANGVPQLRTNGTVEIVTPVVRVARGERGWFTWAPRNLGGDHDMCILRIRPLNAAGRWVNLALDPMPQMSGGASQPRVGGDTRGLRKGGGFFGSAAPIDAIIQPGTADRESISFDVPADAKPGTYHILLALEGTFPTIRADIEVRVS